MRHANMEPIRAWASENYHPGLGLRAELLGKMERERAVWRATPSFGSLGEYRWWEPAEKAIARLEGNAQWAAERWPVRGLRKATLVREYKRVIALEVLVNLSIGI